MLRNHTTCVICNIVDDKHSVTLYIVQLNKTIMKHFQLINGESRITFHFPTSLVEIRENYLKGIGSGVNIADNYVLIGLVYHESLGSIIITRKQAKKSFSSGVVPIFIKAGNTENEFIKSINIKDKLIIPTSALQLAQHVIAPNNVLSLDCFIKYLDKDVTVASRYNNNYGKEECYFIELKLVPACDIVGCYKKFKTTDNPYLVIGDIYDSGSEDYASLDSDSDDSDSSDSDSE